MLAVSPSLESRPDEKLGSGLRLCEYGSGKCRSHNQENAHRQISTGVGESEEAIRPG